MTGFSNEFLHAFFVAFFGTLFQPEETDRLDPEINLNAGEVLIRLNQSDMRIQHNGKEWNLTNKLGKMSVIDHWADMRKEIERLLLEAYGDNQPRLLFIEEDSRTEHCNHITAALAVNVFIAKMILIADCDLDIVFTRNHAWFRLVRRIGGRMTISSSMILYP